jgi:hypothetical protein
LPERSLQNRWKRTLPIEFKNLRIQMMDNT